ncbi:MAG: nucleoside triphosphate pyrophosphatase [Deltaproteobacteria bacterium]
MQSLILASASPRRRELLERVGVVIEVVPAGVDETPHTGEDPEAYVARIAAAKAAAIATTYPGRWVLAADTTVTIDGQILGKAETGEDAAAMLRLLSGRTHQVITGFAIAGTRAIVETVTSDVDVIPLDASAIADYVACNEWRGKAGAYAIQGIAAAFVRGVRGSVTNIIGLPLVEVLEALRAVGAPGANLAAGVAS